jgi:hypothetical protein
MTFKIELVTDAERSAVLQAIQADLREWRESSLPPAIRRRGVTHLVGSVNGGDFAIRVSPPRRIDGVAPPRPTALPGVSGEVE